MMVKKNIFIVSFLSFFVCLRVTLATPKVVVIGAGLAGLTTAHRLHQKNIDVEVYEARKRVGGRVFTGYTVSEKFGKCTIEFGGQNILDGDEAENMRTLIAEFGFELIGRKSRPALVYVDGDQQFSAQTLIQQKNFNTRELEQKLNELANSKKNMDEILRYFVHQADPLYRILYGCVNCYEGGTLEDLSPVYISTLYRMMMFFGYYASFNVCEEPQDPHKLSYTHASIKGGNGLLTEKLASLLGERIHGEMPLKVVEKTSDGAYLLTFKNGEKVAADVLVLAIPCAVYKDIAFAGDIIDEQKLSAIKQVHYGTHGKILIPLEKEPESLCCFMTQRTNSFFNIDDTAVVLFSKNGAGFFSPETITSSYLQDCSIATLSVGQEALSKKDPVYARDEALAIYDGPVGYSWPNEPYSQGSYSYIAAGQEEVLMAMHEVNGEQVRTLFAPLNNNTLYFAGEHTTTNFGIIGTMEAACESGERAARMIEKAITKE